MSEMFYIYRVKSLEFYDLSASERGAKVITTRANKEAEYRHSRNPEYNETFAYATESKFNKMVAANAS